MEHFTRAWASGELDDEGYARVINSYRAYLASMVTDKEICKFTTQISLNGAWVDRFTCSRDYLSVRLLIGDRQFGYWLLDINYAEGRVTSGQAALEEAVGIRPTEIWHDEFSGAPPAMEHRFMLVEPGGTSDRGEVHIRFTTLTFSKTPVVKRELPAL